MHTLDIFKVLTTARGHILVLDLDRAVVLYTLDESRQTFKARNVVDEDEMDLLGLNQMPKSMIRESGWHSGVIMSRLRSGIRTKW